MNRILKYVSVCGCALLLLQACSDKEKDIEKNDALDEEYYASIASVSSSDAAFSATSEGGEIVFATAGGEVAVNVDCGTQWDAENNATDIFTAVCDWEAGTLTVSAGQNTVQADRTGEVKLVTVGQRIQFAKITLVQNAYGAPEITVGTAQWLAPARGALSTEISVDCPIDWKAACDASWLSVEETADGVALTAQENASTETRSTEVRLTCSDGIRSYSQPISVVQDGAAYISLSADMLEVVETGQTDSAVVESNFDWDYSYDASNGWFTVSRLGNTLTVTAVANNEDENDREGTITIEAGDGAENTASASIRVVQDGLSNALVFVYTTTAANTTVTLPLYGDVDCTVAWGDDSSESVTETLPTHTYAEAGSYEVSIIGTVTALTSSNRSTTSQITGVSKYLSEVKQWGKTGLTDMERGLYGCSLLTSLPADISGAFENVTTFRYAFRSCSGLTEIPADLFAHCVNATSFEACFFGCSKLTTVPEALFANCGSVIEFEHLFYNCTSLASVPGGLFANSPNATNFTQTFGGCKKLTEIPEEIFANNTKATTFTGTFNSCTSLTSIPEGLFKNNTAVTEFDYTFEICSALTTVPEGLFANNTNVTSFPSTFLKCSSVESVLDKLFANNTKVTMFSLTFDTCKKLAEVPAGLFANNTAVTSFQSVFGSCSALASIPPTLFANNVNAINFTATFYGCPITEIPADLFAGCPQATNFTETFMKCTSLTSVPDGLLSACTSAYSFIEMFSGCTNLTAIANPEGLFASCPNALSFENTFYNCSALASDISGIFAGNMYVNSFYRTFYGCTSLTCESPYNLLEDDTKVHLYEREDYPDLFSEPSYMSGCFSNCTGLSDYLDIPKDWR